MVAAIAGVAIAAGAFLLILAFVVFWLYKRRHPPKVPPRSPLRPAPPVPPRSRHRYHQQQHRERRKLTASMTVHRASVTPPAALTSSASSSRGTQTSMIFARDSKPMIERLSWVKEKAGTIASSPLQRSGSNSSSSSAGKRRRASHRHAFITRHSGAFAELPGCSVEPPRVPQRATIRGFSLRVPPPLPQLPSSSVPPRASQNRAPSRPPSTQLTPLKTVGGTSPGLHHHQLRMSKPGNLDQTSPRSFPRTPRPESTWSVNSCGLDRFPVSPETPSTGGTVGGGAEGTAGAAGRLHPREGSGIGQRKGSNAWTIQEDSEWRTPSVI